MPPSRRWPPWLPATSWCAAVLGTPSCAWPTARAARGCTPSTSAVPRRPSAVTISTTRPSWSARSISPCRSPRTTRASNARWPPPCAGPARPIRVGAGCPTTGGALPSMPRCRRGAGGPAPPGRRLCRPGQHLRSLVQADRVRRELADLRKQIRGHTDSLALRFDRVLRLLEAWGYLDGWALTPAGEVLVRIFHECDLLIAEADVRAVRRPRRPLAGGAGVVLHLRAPRPDGPPSRGIPSLDGPRALPGAATASPTSSPTTRRSRLPTTRHPDAGFFHLAHAWAAGNDRLVASTTSPSPAATSSAT